MGKAITVHSLITVLLMYSRRGSQYELDFNSATALVRDSWVIVVLL